MRRAITASPDFYERLDRFFDDFFRAELQRPVTERNKRNLQIGTVLQEEIKAKLCDWHNKNG